MNINYHLKPSRYRRICAHFGDTPIKLLDVGTAADSVGIARRWLPQCRYFGLDITDQYLKPEDRAYMEKLILADLESDTLDQLEDDFFDAIIVSHVIEHLAHGLEALERLCRKLAPGGGIYIEFPSVRSLNLPEARHTLNFSDDETHIRLYDVKEVANAMMSSGLRVIRAGRRREWARVLLSVATFPRHGIGLWDLMGFADFVYARKP